MAQLNNVDVVPRFNRPTVENKAMLELFYINNGSYTDPYQISAVIFFTRKQLLIQTYETLKGLGFDVGVCFGDGVDIKPITLCTARS